MGFKSWRIVSGGEYKEAEREVLIKLNCSWTEACWEVEGIDESITSGDETGVLGGWIKGGGDLSVSDWEVDTRLAISEERIGGLRGCWFWTWIGKIGLLSVEKSCVVVWLIFLIEIEDLEEVWSEFEAFGFRFSGRLIWKVTLFQNYILYLSVLQ